MVGWSVTPVRPAAVLHYSEDASIEVFEPHVPTTNSTSEPLVWAIEPRYAPLYWFPRDCPRVAVWANDDSQHQLLRRTWGSSADRVQFVGAADESWIRSTTLCEYSFAPEAFVPWPDAEGQWVSTDSIVPLRRRMVGDLVDAHANEGVDLRWVDDLAAPRESVLASGLPFSVIRWAQRT